MNCQYIKNNVKRLWNVRERLGSPYQDLFVGTPYVYDMNKGMHGIII